MTGYGKCDLEEDGYKVHAEISTVNHRYCDINSRMPRSLAHLEEMFRKLIKAKIARGKIELNLSYTATKQEEVNITIDEALCSEYIRVLRQVGEAYQLVDNLGLAELMKFPDILTVQKQAIEDEGLQDVLKKAIEGALEELIKMREKEGQALKKDILIKADNILETVLKIEAISETLVDSYRIKLEERIEKLTKTLTIDETRVAMEIALFADKCAIDEEIIRLKSHIAQLNDIIEQDEAVGRKLDFLMQEMNREANTIASKASNSQITAYAVELKTEIEKIREQIQNIE